MKAIVDLPGTADCCWTATTPQTSYPALSKAARTDVAIIGAGIVGLTAAYALCRAGVSVTVIEALRVGRQVTGRSSAKITSQHSLIYRHLRDTFDLDTARAYAEANRAGTTQIRTWIRELGIACDLEEKDAYAYTCKELLLAEIEAEAAIARELGFKADVVAPAPLPFETAGALRFPGEAQFNPAQYLVGLAAAVKAAGGSIFENTRVHDVKPGRRWRVMTERGRIDAESVVVATNLPVAGPGHYDVKTRPRGHIAMGFRVDSAAAVEGMFIGIDHPTHSIRTGRDDEGPLLIVLGPAFVTGQEGDVAARFRQLDEWAHKNLPVRQAAWRWFNEDYDTPDRVPYVGEPEKKSKGLYIATGFNGWGISNGAAAGLLISDQIQGRSNPWAKLYDPRRRSPKNIQQRRRHAFPCRQHRRDSTRSRRRHQTRQSEACRIQGGQRARSCAVGIVHSRGLHRQLEQCRSDLGLSVPRLGIFGHRTSHSWPGDQAFTVEKIGKSQAEAAAEETQSRPKELG